MTKIVQGKVVCIFLAGLALSPGVYMLRATIRDPKSQQIVRRTIDLELEP